MLSDDPLYLMRLQAIAAVQQPGSVQLACRVLEIPLDLLTLAQADAAARPRDPATPRASGTPDAERHPAKMTPRVSRTRG